ncbi:MAG: extracellular solute-binding protein [Spirochaetaceae bacterium]|jgi:putative aldouronate transport system substrate-binding protein|nr:extracellular solute-binding protein [Spirochaetaceae bacterium]
MKHFKNIALMVSLCFMMAEMAFAAGRTQTGTASAGGKPVLTIGMESNSFITDYENNYLTQYLEKLHNIDIQFYMLPESAPEIRTKVALMVSSGDLPDIIITDDLALEAIFDYGSKGLFIPLDKYLSSPQSAPYFYQIPEEDRKAYLQYVTSADGHVYHLARYEPETWNLTPTRQYINKAWLDKLGIPLPTTTDELRRALITIKDRDPNGNGRKDEIGISGWFRGTYGENPICALINSFIFYTQSSSSPGLTLDATGKKVIAPFTEPDFRKALQYLNTLYKDGVLSASIFTNDQQQFRAELNNNPAIVALTTSGSLSNWPQASVDKNANFAELRMIAPFKGPAGIAYSPYTGFVPNSTTFITAKCKNPDLAFKVMDSMFEHTLSIIQRFGEEGVDWTRDPKVLAQDTNAYVAMGIYPSLSIVEMTDIWNAPSNKFWHNQGPRYASMQQGNTRGSLQAPYNPNSYAAMVNGYNYQYNLNAHPEHILPSPLKYTAAEAEKIAEPTINVSEYVFQAIAEFTIGNRDINNDTQWNNYLRDLNSAGLQTWISTAQAAFDRVK